MEAGSPDKVGSIESVNERLHQNETREPCTLVLSLFFKHVYDVGELKRYRLVSRTWRDIVMDQWRSSAPFLIYTKREVKNTNGITLDELFTSGVANEKQLIPELKERPFQKVKISPRVYLPPQTGPNTSESLFWTVYGTHIKSLHIPNVFVYEGKETSGFTWLAEHCPHLENLEMSPFIIYKGNDKENADTKKIKGLKVLSNLKSLSILGIRNMLVAIRTKPLFFGNTATSKHFLGLTPNLKKLLFTPNPEHFLEALKYPVGGNGGFVTLSHLELAYANAHSLQLLLKYIENVSPPLHCLKFCFVLSDSRKTPYFQNIMRLLQNSLKRINLRIEIDSESLNPPYFNDLNELIFPELTELSLEFNFCHSLDNNYPNPVDFSILKSCPKLRRCWFWISAEGRNVLGKVISLTKLTQAGNNNSKENVNSNVSLVHLEEFSFNGRFNHESLIMLSEWMPKIRAFTAVLDEESQEALKVIWPSLEKVTLLPT